MSRVVTGGVVLMALAAVLVIRSAVVAQAPPVLVPETPPELPGGPGEATPPQEHSHDHSGHSHEGHTHAAPADRPPTLAPRGAAQPPAEPPYGLGPHGGKVVPVGDGRWHVELVYDQADHAITIYLPPATGVSAHESDWHGHGASGAPAPGAFAPPTSYDDHSYGSYPCPLGQAGAGRSYCPLHPQEAYRQPVQHAGEYECEYERRNRESYSRYPNDGVAPHPAWGN